MEWDNQDHSLDLAIVCARDLPKIRVLDSYDFVIVHDRDLLLLPKIRDLGSRDLACARAWLLFVKCGSRKNGVLDADRVV